MTSSPEDTLASSQHLEAEIGRRLERLRLARNVTRAALAREAGVSTNTVGRLEKGQGASLETLIRVMTALRLQGHLAALVPDASVSPLERVGLSSPNRRRARPPKVHEPAPWKWGDEEDDHGS